MTYAAYVGADVSARAVIDRFMFDVEILLLTRRLEHEIREMVWRGITRPRAR